MSSRDKKDARRIVAEFEFEEVGIGGRHGRRDRNYREREREPPPPPPHPQRQQPEHPPPSAPAVVRPPGPGRRRDGFGAALTVEGGEDPSPRSNTPQESRAPSPPRGDVDPAVAEYVARCAIWGDFFFDGSVIQAACDLHLTFTISSAEYNQRYPSCEGRDTRIPRFGIRPKGPHFDCLERLGPKFGSHGEHCERSS